MDFVMEYQRLLYGFALSLAIFFIPLTAIANTHLISIKPIEPFPAVRASTVAHAVFSVTNIAWAPFKVIDKSVFSASSGVSIVSSTCDQIIKPGESCNIRLRLLAPNKVTVIKARLTETVELSPDITDKVYFPLTINIIENRYEVFNIEAYAGANGTVSPTHLDAEKNSSATFTAHPYKGYRVDRWELDDKLVQDGGETFQLCNITSSHEVNVYFSQGIHIIIDNQSNGKFFYHGNVAPYDEEIDYSYYDFYDSSNVIPCITIEHFFSNDGILFSGEVGRQTYIKIYGKNSYGVHICTIGKPGCEK